MQSQNAPLVVNIGSSSSAYGLLSPCRNCQKLLPLPFHSNPATPHFLTHARRTGRGKSLLANPRYLTASWVIAWFYALWGFYKYVYIQNAKGLTLSLWNSWRHVYLSIWSVGSPLELCCYTHAMFCVRGLLNKSKAAAGSKGKCSTRGHGSTLMQIL